MFDKEFGPYSKTSKGEYRFQHLFDTRRQGTLRVCAENSMEALEMVAMLMMDGTVEFKRNADAQAFAKGR